MVFVGMIHSYGRQHRGNSKRVRKNYTSNFITMQEHQQKQVPDSKYIQVQMYSIFGLGVPD